MAALHFRTAAGAEIDLVLEKPSGDRLAVEIKRTLQPKLDKGFCLGCEDIQASERFYVLPDGDAFPLDRQTTAIALIELMARFRQES